MVENEDSDEGRTIGDNFWTGLKLVFAQFLAGIITSIFYFIVLLIIVPLLGYRGISGAGSLITLLAGILITLAGIVVQGGIVYHLYDWD